jgi:hypothetical protein
MPNNDPGVPSLSSDKRREIDAYLERVRTPATVVPGTRGRLIFALHGEPPAHLGHCLPFTGRHVSRGGGDRRTRCAAGLLSR